MPYAKARDGIKLYYEDTGIGTPIVFVHEFGGTYQSWEPQVSFFSRRYRCIRFAARGYPPSDVPDAIEFYSQGNAATDICAILDHLALEKAHICGLSMGGFATLHFGLDYSDRARSLTVAGAGYGAEKQHEQYFKGVSLEVAAQFERLGSDNFAKTYAVGASRVQFQNKDPVGWQRFAETLGRHSAIGAAMTMRGVQALRPSLYDLEERLRAMHVPTLVLVGDEDDHCLQPGLFLKRTLPSCGLAIFPKTGHTLNLEEPALFNQFVAEFLAMVEANRWTERDPRARPQEIMKTK